MSVPGRRNIFVLGGGGTLGSFQAGAVLGLAEAGVLPDAIFSCSAGALNGAVLAAAPTLATAALLVDWWLSPAGRNVFAPSPWRRARGIAAAASTRSSGLLDPGPLRRIISARVPAHDISELAIPLTVTTTCLDCGLPVHHSRGPVADVLAASCALPGLFPPVLLADGHLHVDGGVLCGVPLAAALAAAGPDDRVLVLDCGLTPVTGPPGACAVDPAAISACGLPVLRDGASYVAPVDSAPGVIDVVLRAFTVARGAANRAAVSAGLTDPRVSVLPHVPDAWAAGLLDRMPTGWRDFGATAALVQAGRTAATQWLPTTTFQESGAL
ncbi:MAG: hypothetical protein NVSMB55_08360 [Mycobacteriales bacterium]